MQPYQIIERCGVVGLITKIEGNKYMIMFEHRSHEVEMAVYTNRDMWYFRVVG